MGRPDYQGDELLDLIEGLINGHEQEGSSAGDSSFVPAYAGLRYDLRLLHHRAAGHIADGWPTSSVGGSGSPTNELDDDGTPVPQHSDPVGNAVIARADESERKDMLTLAKRDALNHVRDAWRSLELAMSAIARTQPPKEVAEPEWCKSCLRVGVCSPIYEKAKRHMLCSWCYGWSADEARARRLSIGSKETWPPKALVEKHCTNKKVTLRDVEKHAPHRAKAMKAAS